MERGREGERERERGDALPLSLFLSGGTERRERRKGRGARGGEGGNPHGLCVSAVSCAPLCAASACASA
eukprot:1544268-Rhodomonas_salina.1